MLPSILAIIPARGGSKGLKHKNIKPLLHKPLIAWTIEQARQSRYITTMVVSTDSPGIAKIAENSGVPVPELRPAELATDTSPIIDSINYILDTFEKKGRQFDIIVLLEPTSPLRKAGDIDRAIEQFMKKSDTADALVSVGEVQLEHPYYLKTIDDEVVRPFFKADDDCYQRQKLPKIFFPYGVIYLSKVSSLKTTGTFYQERTLPYRIERWQNYEINDSDDFIVVETMLKAHLREVTG
jgi:CMP-N,N'-diacetyllegionaminic acid synthase